MDSGMGKFKNIKRGQYEHKFLMDQEDLKLQFKRWIRKNIKELCVESAQAFLKNMLKRKVGPHVLELHNIMLPDGSAAQVHPPAGGITSDRQHDVVQL